MSIEQIKGTQSFSRSMDVLQIISDQAMPIVFNDILKKSELTRPTLYRILSSLEEESLIHKTNSKYYKLGTRLISLAHNALAQIDIRQIAYTALSELRDETGETVHLAVRNKDMMVYVEKFESKEIVRMTSIVGTVIPFYSSSVGKAYLAGIDKNKLKEILKKINLLPQTTQTKNNLDKIYKDIELTNKNGYSFDNEENENGIICFGASIKDDTSFPVASVSVSIPTFRLKKDRTIYWKPLLSKCYQISKLLGYVNKEDNYY
ncbi:IclR family transcriptional regulator [Alphaproteobacteria bacterium]|nr:IclR family transcriptional regulator [Alphaproteobacteria bacterium]